MSIELDWFRFTTAAASVTHALVQLCKYPFSWGPEWLQDIGKYALVWAPVGLITAIHHQWGGVALWLGLWGATVFWNWKDNNIG